MDRRTDKQTYALEKNNRHMHLKKQTTMPMHGWKKQTDICIGKNKNNVHGIVLARFLHKAHNQLAVHKAKDLVP
jgi:hypothetical protein